jgi:hypothetical protein
VAYRLNRFVVGPRSAVEATFVTAFDEHRASVSESGDPAPSERSAVPGVVYLWSETEP